MKPNNYILAVRNVRGRHHGGCPFRPSPANHWHARITKRDHDH